MLSNRHWLMGCLVLLLSGCASQRVDWDYDMSAKARQQMDSWKTYAWLPVSQEQSSAYHLDGLQDRRVRAAVNRDLQAKGFQLVKESDADFLVNYLSKIKTRREENQVTTSLGYGYNSWGMGFQTETRVRDYEEGSLMVDFIDPASKDLIWRGRSQARIPDRSTPEKRTEQINKAVDAILKGFPPASGS